MTIENKQIQENLNKMSDKIDSLIDIHNYFYESAGKVISTDRCDNNQLKLLITLSEDSFLMIKTAEEKLRKMRNILSMYV